jgi:hypothetical protein
VAKVCAWHLAAVLGIAVSASCGAPASSDAPARTATAATPGDGGSDRVDIDEIFPPGPGRELVLNNCTSCHTFVPIVVLQMTKDAWDRNGRDHRERVTALTDAEFKTAYEYLAATFNPDRPVPTLPKELLDTWTSY